MKFGKDQTNSLEWVQIFFFWYQNGEKKCIAFGRSLTQGFRENKKKILNISNT